MVYKSEHNTYTYIKTSYMKRIIVLLFTICLAMFSQAQSYQTAIGLKGGNVGGGSVGGGG